MYEGAFTDANGRRAEPLDVVEYDFGARRGILLNVYQDGDAEVRFRDTKKIETVKFCRLCKVPESPRGDREGALVATNQHVVANEAPSRLIDWAVSIFRAHVRGVAGSDVRDKRMTQQEANSWVDHTVSEFKESLEQRAKL